MPWPDSRWWWCVYDGILDDRLVRKEDRLTTRWLFNNLQSADFWFEGRWGCSLMSFLPCGLFPFHFYWFEELSNTGHRVQYFDVLQEAERLKIHLAPYKHGWGGLTVVWCWNIDITFSFEIKYFLDNGLHRENRALTATHLGNHETRSYKPNQLQSTQLATDKNCPLSTHHRQNPTMYKPSQEL